jgi:peptidoglycan/xylan/chitin deacetylase (PgdA/CDA1 family)
VKAGFSLSDDNLKDLLYSSFSRLGGDRLIWTLGSSRLRILCYHGICLDTQRNQPWVPTYFVAQSAFEAQLVYLRHSAQVLPLREAVARLHKNQLPPRAVSITFDDGYANNLQIAYPLLKKYGLPATIFVCSSYAESGELFPFLKLKLIRLAMDGGGAKPVLSTLPDYKSVAIDSVRAAADRSWSDLNLSLSPDQWQTLRVMTPEEIGSFDTCLVETGSHTDTHCILKNECRDRRRLEIRDSIRKISEWTGWPIRLFSYPNGEPGDFDELDREVLRAEGVEAAVTGISGANDTGADLLQLKRYPVTRDHDDYGFRAEVTGFRNALRSFAGRLN